MDPTPPYRWHALLLEGTWAPHVEAARLQVEQPDLVRVLRADGSVLHQVRQGGLAGTPEPGRPPEPPPRLPELDQDGLVVSERQPWNDGPDVPMWQDYRFVAVLDPYELSDGVEVLELSAVDHDGRPAWEALLRPTPDDSPRCACCPLMQTRDTDLMEGRDPLPAYADAHRVRLDVGTGVCVRTHEVGGPSDGAGHDLVLLRVTP